MKLKWEIIADGWTSIRTLCLLNKRGLVIWRSKDHLHQINQEQFDNDFKFLVGRYGINESSKFDIEESVINGRVT